MAWIFSTRRRDYRLSSVVNFFFCRLHIRLYIVQCQNFFNTGYLQNLVSQYVLVWKAEGGPTFVEEGRVGDDGGQGGPGPAQSDLFGTPAIELGSNQNKIVMHIFLTTAE